MSQREGDLKSVDLTSVVFTDINKFSEEAGKRNLEVEVSSLVSLRSNYLKQLDNGIVMKVIDYDEEQNKILIFLESATLVYTSRAIPRAEVDRYEEVIRKPHGLTTVLALLVLSQSVESFNKRRERLLEDFKTLEANFDEVALGLLTRQYDEYYDRLEDLSEIMLKLEERSIPQVETNYIAFDYSILLAEVNNLLDRAKTRIGMMRDMAHGYELKISRQLNKRIEELNDIVKKLTALTVILMIPNIIAAHFGMNFRYMPELEIVWAYPMIVVSQFVVTGVMLLLFRKKRWV